MSGYFKTKKITDLTNINSESKFDEADYSFVTFDNKFVQLEYVNSDDKKLQEYDVKPGIWTIQKTSVGLELQATSFVKDKILETFFNTEKLENIVDCFFAKFDIYKKYGIEVPKRGVLLFGVAGSGKTSAITTTCNKYVKDNKTAVIIWTTDKFEAHVVKDFVKSFKYINGVEKLMLIAEDIGGSEIDNVRARSDSSLLSLLDNKEKTFKIPVLILATTNYPEIFMGNLTNRPDRFDDKLEMGYPDSKQRSALLKFFLKKKATKNMDDLIKSKECDEFTPAHIRDIGLRMDLFDKSGEVVIKEMIVMIKEFKNNFAKAKPSMSLGSYDEDDE